MGRAGAASLALALLLLTAAPHAHAEAAPARRSWRSADTSTHTASQHEPAGHAQQHEPARVSEQSQCACPELTCAHNSPPPASQHSHSQLSSLDVLLVSHCLALALGFWLGKSRGRQQQKPPHAAAANTGPCQQAPTAEQHAAPATAHSQCNGTISASARDAASTQPPSVQPQAASLARSNNSSKPLDAPEPVAAAASPQAVHKPRSASPQCSGVHACAGSSPDCSSAVTRKTRGSGVGTPEHALQREEGHGLQQRVQHQHEHVEHCPQQAVREQCSNQQQAGHQLQAQQQQQDTEQHGVQAAHQEGSERRQGQEEEQRQREKQPTQASPHDQLLPSKPDPPSPPPPPPPLVSSPTAPWPEHNSILARSNGSSLAPVHNTSTQGSQHELATLASQLHLLLSGKMSTDKLQIVHHHEHTHSLDPRSYEQAIQLAGELQAMADRGVAAQSLKLGAQHLGTMSQSLHLCVQYIGDAFAFVNKWYARQMMKQQKELCTRCLQGGFCVMLLVLLCSACAHGRLSRLADLAATCSSRGESSAWFSPSRWASMLLASGRLTGALGWVLCVANELGLFGLGITGFAVAALKVPRLLTDVHHSWQFYLPVCMGCAGGYAGTNLVSALGGGWLVWLVLWEAWVAVCCGMYAWEVSSWKVRSLLVVVLSIALPCPMGFLPFHWTAAAAERLLQGLLL